MAKKEQPTNNNTNSNVVNVNVPRTRKPRAKKDQKPNWLIKAIVIATIGLVVSVILIYVKHSTAANGKPAFIQNGTPAENTK